MLNYFLNNRGSITIEGVALMILAYAVVLLLVLPVHEFAHAFVAHLCGDDTAKWYGRLTLNPFRHLDLWGTLMMLLVGFGYAKPVPVNTRNLRNYKRDSILVALAGPLSNFLMAFLAAAIFRICLIFVENMVVLSWLYLVLVDIVATVNISLMVFNLLPVPPLDGSRLWSSLLPGRWAYRLEQYSRYITMILFVALMSGVLNMPLWWLRYGVGSFIGWMLGVPNLFFLG